MQSLSGVARIEPTLGQTLLNVTLKNESDSLQVQMAIEVTISNSKEELCRSRAVAEDVKTLTIKAS